MQVGGLHLRARKRVGRAKQFLSEAGVEQERLEMFNLSSAEGPRFAEIVKEMSARIAPLGPSPLRKNQSAMDAGIAAIEKQTELAIQGGRK